jgi:predicted AAA+ superfamily ATPase
VKRIKRILNLTQILKRKGLFLFGARQTGKSSYLRETFPEAEYVDLLLNENFSLYTKNPENFRKKIELILKNSPQKLIIVDEIQRIPQLLNEIHSLVENYAEARFILTGSSAVKLKKSGVNLLAGRLSLRNFFPFCYPEIISNGREFDLLKILNFGTLPSIVNSSNPYADLLDYVGLYLKEEIRYEGLVQDLSTFSEFLHLVAVSNSQQINYASFASDAQLSPHTIKSYFKILEDTLIGHLLPPFGHSKKRKTTSSAKFYFFDAGIVNAILRRRELAEATIEFGVQLEQYIFQELKAYISLREKEHSLEFWRVDNKYEVDFVIYEKLEEIFAIEVKATKRPSKSDFKGLIKFQEEFPLKRKIMICTTISSYLEDDGTEILTVTDFLNQLWHGKIF